MKFSDIKTDNGGQENPCELLAQYMLAEEQGETLSRFLQRFDFESREEIERAIRSFIRAAALDKYMSQKHLAERNAFAAAVHTRYNRIYVDEGKFSKLPVTMSGEIWHGGYCRKLLAERTDALIKSAKPSATKFAAACKTIKSVYGLDDLDVEKLRFFVEQVKAGEEFPNSLRRMLYLWGAAKGTGKTTTATMLVCLLNGDEEYKNISKYSTTLSNEMQIKAFALPKISESNICLMDECFYADMGKTYADFKRFITSSNGRARLPFGQEFEWYGQPNYVATSNEPLQKFIKDWGDRRYLAVEFKEAPKRQMTFEEIQALWLSFIVNSTREKEWKAWHDELAPVAEEKGDRQEVADDIEIELRKLSMLDKVLGMDTPNNSPSCPENRIPLKWFVDLFSQSMGTVEAHKRKGEIEAAVLKVYGPRYSTARYWLLSGMKETASKLRYQIYDAETQEGEQETKEDAEGEILPF